MQTQCSVTAPFYTLRRENVILKPAEEMQLWDLRKLWKELLRAIFLLYHMQDADASPVPLLQPESLVFLVSYGRGSTHLCGMSESAHFNARSMANGHQIKLMSIAEP